MGKDEILSLLRTHRAGLRDFGVRTLALFGSVARGDASEESDVDMLVEFDRPVGMFEFVRLQRYLEQLIGRPVDLVTPDALKAPVRERVLAEAVHAT